MRLSSVLLLMASMLTACGVASSAPQSAAKSDANARFTDLSQRWLDGAMRLSPVGATQTGDHRFDSELDDLSADGRAKSVAFSHKMLDELDAIDRKALSRDNQVDAAMLQNQLRYDIWNNDKLQAWAWDPQIYSQLAGNALYTLMARDFAPVPERLRAATARMEKIPALFEQMRANLVLARVPLIHAQTVAKQNKGVVSLVDELITPHLAELPDADRKRLEAAIANLRKAVDEQQVWLDKTLVPNAKGDFRLGKELYDAKLAFALDSPLSREEIGTRARAEMARVRVEMYGLARDVLAKKPDAPALPDNPDPKQQQAAIQAALELTYAERPARDQVVPTAKSALAAATEFVSKHDLITLPDSPVDVILMPEFQRGATVAYCDSPGPLDKGLHTFFAVSPIPDDWTADQTTSFLREYNNRSIDELSVHEAMPGHYVQIWHSNKNPSTLRAVLSSGSFVEGWAVYAEKMMVDEGFRDHDPLYKLMNLKWYLRVIANSLLDQGIQVDGMTREQAMQLMTEQAFQQEREAAGKWVRAELSAAQLPTYFVGVQEQMDLRHEAEHRAGAHFDLKTYHDTVLSFGSPPARYVHELMFDEPIR